MWKVQLSLLEFQKWDWTEKSTILNGAKIQSWLYFHKPDPDYRDRMQLSEKLCTECRLFYFPLIIFP